MYLKNNWADYITIGDVRNDVGLPQISKRLRVENKDLDVNRR